MLGCTIKQGTLAFGVGLRVGLAWLGLLVRSDF